MNNKSFNSDDGNLLECKYMNLNLHKTSNTKNVGRKTIKFIYTNADCLTTNNYHELIQLVQQNNVEIVAITETNPKITQQAIDPNDVYEMKGFDMFYNGEVGRGIIMYIHSSLKAVEINYDKKYEEVIWLQLKLINDKKILLACIYRSPNSPRDNSELMIKMMNEMLVNKY